MKLRYLIILIVFISIVGSYFIIVPIAVGTHDLFNLYTVIMFPNIVGKFIAQEGNGIICLDACGPCSAYGPWHILVDGECVIPGSPHPTLEKIDYISNQTNSSKHDAIVAYNRTNGDVEKAIELIQQNKLITP